MLSTENGEQAFMEGNMSFNLAVEFEHKPNELISFINNQCLLNFEQVKIPYFDQEFLDKVYNTPSGIITRLAPRRTGGSTLMLLIAFYFKLFGKEVKIISPNSQMNQNLKSLCESINVVPYTIKASNYGISIRSQSHQLSIALEAMYYHNYGNKYDVLIFDSFDQYGSDVSLLDVAARSPDARIIVNLAP